MMGTVPVVQWTRYGRWTPDGLHVLNQNDETIYTHPAYYLRPLVPTPAPALFVDVQRD